MKTRNRYNPSRRGNYRGNKKSLTYWLSDVVFGIFLFGAILFALSIFNNLPHYTPEQTKEIAKSIDSIEESIGTPNEWHILSVSPDYSEAQVLIKNGEIHLYTVFAATDDEVIININDELHSFAWSRG